MPMTFASARFMSDNCAFAIVHLYINNVFVYFGLKYTEKNNGTLIMSLILQKRTREKF